MRFTIIEKGGNQIVSSSLSLTSVQKWIGWRGKICDIIISPIVVASEPIFFGWQGRRRRLAAITNVTKMRFHFQVGTHSSQGVFRWWAEREQWVDKLWDPKSWKVPRKWSNWQSMIARRRRWSDYHIYQGVVGIKSDFFFFLLKKSCGRKNVLCSTQLRTSVIVGSE